MITALVRATEDALKPLGRLLAAPLLVCCVQAVAGAAPEPRGTSLDTAVYSTDVVRLDTEAPAAGGQVLDFVLSAAAERSAQRVRGARHSAHHHHRVPRKPPARRSADDVGSEYERDSRDSRDDSGDSREARRDARRDARGVLRENSVSTSGSYRAQGEVAPWPKPPPPRARDGREATPPPPSPSWERRSEYSLSTVGNGSGGFSSAARRPSGGDYLTRRDSRDTFGSTPGGRSDNSRSSADGGSGGRRTVPRPRGRSRSLDKFPSRNEEKF
jgi:hypothetical protein